MNKIQRAILLGYCIAVFLLGFIFVPWRAKIDTINVPVREELNNEVIFAPLWTKKIDRSKFLFFNVNRTKIVKQLIKEGMSPKQAVSTACKEKNKLFFPEIDINTLAIELVCITLITIAAFLAFSKRSGS